MKFDPRRNGRRMTTVQTKHYLGSHEIARLLVKYANRFGRPDASRKGLEAVIRQQLQVYGGDSYADPDLFHEMGDEEQTSMIDWVVTTIMRVFPELVDSKLEEFRKGYMP